MTLPTCVCQTLNADCLDCSLAWPLILRQARSSRSTLPLWMRPRISIHPKCGFLPHWAGIDRIACSLPAIWVNEFFNRHFRGSHSALIFGKARIRFILTTGRRIRSECSLIGCWVPKCPMSMALRNHETRFQSSTDHSLTFGFWTRRKMKSGLSLNGFQS